MTTLTRFRDLRIGQTFDFVDDHRPFNSYFRRCVKTGKRTYTPVEGEDAPTPMNVRTINIEVYHVGE